MGLRKSVNSLLGFYEVGEHLRRSPQDRRRSMHHPHGEGLRLFAGPPPEKIHVGLRDRLRLCTENLGSESCEGTLEPEEEAALEEAAADEEAERAEAAAAAGGEVEDGGDVEWPLRWRRQEEEERRKFPPPLRWMADGDGRPKGFMKAAREGGRLILREVRLERPEVLRATREGGRLKLHLVEAELLGEEARQVQGAEVETPGTAKEEVERWERERFIRRCQEAASGGREVPTWWNHSFATTA